MVTRLLIASVVCVFAVSPVKAGGGTEPGVLLARSIEAYQEIEGISGQMNEASGDLTARQRAVEQAIWVLKEEPWTAEKIEDLAGQVERDAEFIEQQRGSRLTGSSLEHRQRRLDELTLKLEVARLGTEGEREERRTSLEAERDGLNAEIAEIQGPFQEQIKAVQGRVWEVNEPLTELFRARLTAPESAFPGSSLESVNATGHMAFAGCRWVDSEGNQIAWAHFRIRPVSEVTDQDRKELFEGAYPVRALNDNSLWVWAGNFLVTFVVDDESLKSKEAVQDAIHQFVDLEGFSGLSVETDQVASGAVVE